MMENGRAKERDLVLPPNSHAFILNKQKGDVDVFVGPHKSNLDDNTDQPVVFDYQRKTFISVELKDAIKENIVAPEGWYMVLKNPEVGGKHPGQGQSGKVDLEIGKKINIPGPDEFALYPGQMCKVIKGHHIRSNQYLIVRVYDPKEAMKGIGGFEETEGEKAPDELTMGQLLIIKGTAQSFYIPPTGIEVVPDPSGNYVRDAVTLERLEYCVLLDESGNKEYPKGPDVVFPKPTQIFIEKNGARKFKAINLNEISGIHVKVTTEYKDDDGNFHNPGDELFIRGTEQSIYYPREEHAIIKYDGKEIHYASAIPAGEGRYMLNRLTGEITLEKGPQMLLPDPRQFVQVRRILQLHKVREMFPGNEEALQYNQDLMYIQETESDAVSKGEYLSDAAYRNSSMRSMSRGIDFESLGAESKGFKREKYARDFVGDSISKSNKYTKPRTVTLDTKYEGAIRISVWRGYAVLVESKSDSKKNRVVIGPETFLLEYDEDIITMELSSGTPKGTRQSVKTPYLRHMNNTVSDTVTGETSNTVDVTVTLSYKVDFTGDSEKWFNVENYVQHLCDRMRSMIRKMIKTQDIKDFDKNYVDLIRDLVLGKQIEAPTDSDAEIPENVGERRGYLFPENGMKITDVEVLGIKIGDAEIEHQLHNAQIEAVEQTLRLANKTRELENVKQEETINRQINDARSKTVLANVTNKISETKKNSELDEEQVRNKVAGEKLRLELQEKLQTVLNTLNDAELKRKQLKNDQEFDHKNKIADIEIREAEETAKAEIQRLSAFTPQLIAALQADGDKKLLSELSKNFNVPALMSGKSIAETAATVITGLGIGDRINLSSIMGNKTGTNDE